MYTHEVISYHKNLPMKLFFQRIGDVAKHWHQSMELLLVLQGQARVIVENDSYTLSEGDIILINPQQIHETHGEDCTIAMLQIRLSMFHGPDFQENMQFSCNSSLYQNKDRFSNLLSLYARLVQINSVSNQEDRSSMLTISYAYAIIHELLLNFYLPEGTATVHSTETLERLKSITSYIDSHYMENITLKSMAEQQFLSSSYLSHFFEKNMSMTFSTYLSNVRLEHATQELLRTDHFIEDIALNNGFPNSRAFVNAFRKQYQMLPSQYRSNYEPSTSGILEDSKKHNYLELEKHDFLSILNQYLDRNIQNPEIKSELSLNLGNHSINVSGKTSPLQHTFKVFTSVGRASDLLRGEIQEMLTIQQNEIGYQYIKFHGILDDSMMLYREDPQGNPLLSFSHLDMIMDFLRSIGLRPLIQFSFMPRDLAVDPSQRLFSNPVIISPPKDESKWCYLIKEVTRHFIQRYGRQEVRQWLFTFWNETFTTTPFTIGDFSLTCHLYELTYRSVKACDPELPFANPSCLSTHLPDQPFLDFLDYCDVHSCQPDFFVLHFYPISSAGVANFENVKREDFVNLQGGSIILSQDPEFMHKFVQTYQAFRREHPGKKAYLTEWCSTSSHRDYLNDTCFRSAYICKNILENYDELDSFGNWTLTDFIEELPTSDNLFHGGMGIFTKNGIKKPAYYAFYFLSRLQDLLLKKGDGYFATTDGQGRYNILLYNYNHYSNLYAQGILFDASPESRYDVFGDTYSMDLEITLDHLEAKAYHMREQLVNRSYGSCYDEWVRMGAEPLTSSEEVQALKARSVPMLIKNTLETREGQLSYYAHLEPHEIRLVELWPVEG